MEIFLKIFEGSASIIAMIASDQSKNKKSTKIIINLSYSHA